MFIEKEESEWKPVAIPSVSHTNLQEWQNTVGTVNYRNYVPLVIKSSHGQTSNLTEWQDSAGTVVSGIDYNGRFFTTDSKGNKVYLK